MLNCLELIGEIVAIHTLPAGALSFDMPFNVRNPRSGAIRIGGRSITLSDVHQMDGFAVDDYYLYNNVRETSSHALTIEPGVKVKESDKISAAGVYYTTKITASSTDDIADLHSLANKLMSAEYFDCLVVDSLDNVFLLRGVEPATRISVTAGLPLHEYHNVEIEIVSVNGLQPVIFD